MMTPQRPTEYRHWLVSYCTKTGRTHTNHYRSESGYISGWHRVINGGALWALAALYSPDTQPYLTLLKRHGVMR